MTAPAEQRVRHRRRVTGRRAVIGSVAARPTAEGSKAVAKTIKVSGTYDGKLKKFFGKGALGDGSQDEGQDPIVEPADGAVLKNVIIGVPGADGVHCKGNDTGKEPTQLGVGADGTTCKFPSSAITYK